MRIACALTLPMLACQATGPDADVPAPEQQQLRDHGAALYDRVGWTYQHREAAALAQQFTQRHANPDRVMAMLPLEPGDTTADVGAGVGWFTFRLARATGPEGRVLALDIQPEAVELVRARGLDRGINPYDNVEPRISAVHDCELEADSVDLAFMAHLGFYLYPELLDENVSMLASLARAVKPGGHLVVLEYIPPGLTEDHLVPHMRRAGFELQGSHWFEHHQTWLYTFEIPADDKDAASFGA